MEWDAVIVGGGASGLAAGVFLGRQAMVSHEHKKILILEKAPRVGKKLLATGNGTCNISNIHAVRGGYHGATALGNAVIKAFPPQDAMDFFSSLGVDTVIRENGRVYPRPEQASAVLDGLRLELNALGVEIKTDCLVTKLKPLAKGWQVESEQEIISAKTVLLCCGGVASPSLGGSTEGYRLLAELGVDKTPLFPSIVQIRTQTDFVRAVKGLRVDATVTLRDEKGVLSTQTGEVLFTEYGLSGPAVMQISRPVGDWERRQKGELTVSLDLLPTMEKEELLNRLHQRKALKGRLLEDYLTGFLNKRVGQTVLRKAEVSPLSRPADSLTDREIQAIADTVKCWDFTVKGTQGFAGAQVTAGGIKAEYIDPSTMAIKGKPGLFIAGEMTDVDGDCGGYNLQFAWSSSFVATQGIIAYW